PPRTPPHPPFPSTTLLRSPSPPTTCLSRNACIPASQCCDNVNCTQASGATCDAGACGCWGPTPKLCGTTCVPSTTCCDNRECTKDRKSTRLNSSHLGISYA